MSHTVAIAGAGVLGRLLALALHRKGWTVSLYDRGGPDERPRAATGLIAPYVGLSEKTRALTLLGEYATEQWPAWVESLPPLFFRENGVLAVAHPRDALELDRLGERIASLAAHDDIMTDCAAADLAKLEPALTGRFTHGLFFPLEQHLDPCSLLRALRAAIAETGLAWHAGTEVTSLSPRLVESARGKESFDWVIDVRGLGAAATTPDLRAVRSECLRVHAPEVNLSRPVRLVHPRHELYIVPHEDHRYVIGTIDRAPGDGEAVSVRSALELLSAAVTVHPGFGSAELLSADITRHAERPSGLPRITPQQGLLLINGLSRHTWLTAPTLCDIAVTFLDTGDRHPMADDVMEEWTL